MTTTPNGQATMSERRGRFPARAEYARRTATSGDRHE
jgi:hypothetical protein